MQFFSCQCAWTEKQEEKLNIQQHSCKLQKQRGVGVVRESAYVEWGAWWQKDIPPATGSITKEVCLPRDLTA